MLSKTGVQVSKRVSKTSPNGQYASYVTLNHKRENIVMIKRQAVQVTCTKYKSSYFFSPLIFVGSIHTDMLQKNILVWV